MYVLRVERDRELPDAGRGGAGPAYTRPHHHAQVYNHSPEEPKTFTTRRGRIYWDSIQLIINDCLK